MTDPINKIQILIRSEIALLRLQTKRMATQTGFRVVALIFAILALAMLTFAGYQALVEPFGSVMAALFVALVDGILALLLLFISQHVGNYREQERALKEVREMAYSELNADFEELKDGVDQVTDDVKRIRDNITTIVSGTSELVTFVTPLLSLLVATIKANKEKEEQ